MSADVQVSAEPKPVASKPPLLGPFLGQVTPTTIKIWLHYEGPENEIHVSVHQQADSPAVAAGVLRPRRNNLFTDCVIITGLSPNTRYFYRLSVNPAYSIPLDLQGLVPSDLHFRTLPDDPNERIDFVVMSCHNPFESTKDGYEGHAVWIDLPQIISSENNPYIRFAVLGGDQVYADKYVTEILNEKDQEARLQLYLKAYRRFWSNINYRRVMCRLPAVMIWDDHEIADGWGSEESSFEAGTTRFKDNWAALFKSAFEAFAIMQASRNPDRLSPETFDCGFRVGKWGFLLLDLRTNRNYKKGQLVTEEQFARIKAWVDQNRSEIHTLFVVSPVVFSHGPPIVERLATKYWKSVLWVVEQLTRMTSWGKGMYARFHESVGDIRDDIRDAWSSEGKTPRKRT